MRPGVRLPHEVMIKDRHESGLPPLEEVAYVIAEEDADSEEPIQEEESDAEGVIDSAIEKMAEIEVDESKEEE